MLKLLLLRHAKTTPGESGMSDFDRHLLPRGRRAATGVGEYLANAKLFPDVVLCSSSKRTRETLAAMLPYLREDMTIHVSYDLYDSSVTNYVSAIRSNGGEAPVVLLVGHNPTMEECAAELLARTRSGGSAVIRFPTSGMAVIDFDISDWGKLKPATGKLVNFVEPHALSLGTDTMATGK